MHLVSPPDANADVHPEPAWFLAYTRPRNETRAREQLARQGYETYLPLYRALRRTAEGMAERREPLFPRYVFFRPGRPGQSITPVCSTLGVSHIVRCGLAPATAEPAVVDALREFETLSEQSDPAQLSPIQPGCRVAVLAGPLKGLDGLVSGRAGQRVTVLLDLLGRQPGVSLPAHHLEVLAA